MKNLAINANRADGVDGVTEFSVPAGRYLIVIDTQRFRAARHTVTQYANQAKRAPARRRSAACSRHDRAGVRHGILQPRETAFGGSDALVQIGIAVGS